MTAWAKSLIKLSTYEVETLQKRLAEIADRRTAAETHLALLTAQGEAEIAAARADPIHGWRITGYLEVLKMRKGAIQSDIDAIAVEEQGARDALAQAFEEQKKYEHIAEQARILAAKEAGKRENAALDELGLRKSARG
jgi:flagellar FliJ protein